MPNKKRKSSQKKRSDSRYVLPPPSPVGTRSKSVTKSKSSAAEVVAATPTLTTRPVTEPLVVPDSLDQSSVRSVISTELKSMEHKWDDRFSQLEDSMRAALSSRPPEPHAPVATAPIPSAVGPTVLASGRVHTSRASSKSSRSASSSTNSSRSSSGRSDSGSRRRHRDSRRSRERSRDRSANTGRRRKHAKYTTLIYLPEFSQVSNYERLVLANARMALRFYKKERDITGILDHIILLAEKAEPGVFDNEALVRYDDSVKLAAYEKGLSQFKLLDPAAIVKHLSYDGTKVAANSRRAAVKRFTATKNQSPQAMSRGGGGGGGPCYKFNFASGGCRRQRCEYRHICAACKGPGHVLDDCPNVVDKHSGGARK